MLATANSRAVWYSSQQVDQAKGGRKSFSCVNMLKACDGPLLARTLAAPIPNSATNSTARQ